MGETDQDFLFDFEKLEVYQKSLVLIDKIFNIYKSLPKDFKISVGSNLVRAALSIANNLAEGNGKKSKREKNRYFGTSLDSARECIQHQCQDHPVADHRSHRLCGYYQHLHRAAFAFSRFCDAIATTSQSAPFCIAGITFLTPILAVLKTPQRTFFIFRAPPPICLIFYQLRC